MARGDKHSYKGDVRDSGKAPIEAKTETRASSKHPDYNEDASIGDVARLKAERENPPPLKTSQPEKDLAALAEASAVEEQHAQALKEKGVHGVLDGVSGESNGGGLLASRIASGKMAEIMSYMPADADAERARRSIEAAIQAAHQAVSEYKQGRPELKQMATTAELVKTIDNGDGTFDVAYGHVGDSRIYVLDGETKKLRVETLDDGVAKEAMDTGQITREQYDQIMNAPDKKSLPPDLQFLYQYRNVVSNVIGMPGKEKIPVATGILKLKKGDRMLMSSDGIHDNLTADQIEEIMLQGGGIKELADAAGKIADSGQGRAKPDDITGSVIEFGGAEKSKDAPTMSPEEAKQAQIRQFEQDVDQASKEIQRLEALKGAAGLKVPGKGGRSDVMLNMDGRAIQELLKMGGEKAVDKKIRDWKIFSLSREYQIAQQDVADRQKELGLSASQAKEQLALQQQVIDWQRQIYDAARSASPEGRGMMTGTSLKALDAVSERMKAGESPQEIMRKAKETTEQAKAKMDTLSVLDQEQGRLDEIADQWRQLEGEKRDEMAAAERSQMDAARQQLESAEPAARQEAQPQQPATDQGQQKPQPKKPWYKRLFGA